MKFINSKHWTKMLAKYAKKNIIERVVLVIK